LEPTRHLLRLAAEVIGQLDPAPLERAAELLYRTWRAEGVVLSCGNGGSASTASHFAADVAKLTVVEGKPRVRAICLNDNLPASSAWTNDAGFPLVFAEQASPWLDARSVVVAFSVHGGSHSDDPVQVSSNLRELCLLGRARGASLIGITGFDGGVLGGEADVSINVPFDQEPAATLLIESVHVLIHHLLCDALRARIAGLDDARA
jgi:D-sedoheptulose 7-phosphate isomerase